MVSLRPLQRQLGQHLRDPLIAARVAEQHHVVLREVRRRDILIIFNARVRRDSPWPTCGRSVPECAGHAGWLPRSTAFPVGRTSRNGSRNASSIGPCRRMCLVQPRPFAGFAIFQPEPVFSSTISGAGFSFNSWPSILIRFRMRRFAQSEPRQILRGDLVHLRRHRCAAASTSARS